MAEEPGPEAVLRYSPEEADRWLDDLERRIPVRPGFLDLAVRGFTEAIVFGDTHGDWRSAAEVVTAFLAEPGGPRCLIGLGDYIDRHPADSPDGSVANAALLLGLVARSPDRVFLIQGNHETARRIPVLPQSLPEEVDELWGPQLDRYVRLQSLFERGPLALGTSNGVYCAHAGFPREPLPASWRRVFEDPDEDRLAQIVWAEADASRGRRGATDAWSARDLGRFFERSGFHVFLRGHDPDLTGRPLYGATCLTLHTSRVYQRYGGVVLARVPLDRPIAHVTEISVEHLSTEGRTFPSAE